MELKGGWETEGRNRTKSQSKENRANMNGSTRACYPNEQSLEPLKMILCISGSKGGAAGAGNASLFL